MKDLYDVLICGGGVAGCAAALSAARMGSKVLLIESEYSLGGLATLGLITHYLPICDGNGKQVCFGLSEEFLRLSVKYGAEKNCSDFWFKKNRPYKESDLRFDVQYNPVMFSLLLEKQLISEGVKILYGTSVVSADVQNEKVKGLTVHSRNSKSPDFEVKARTFIDATGDCTLNFLCGEETVEAKNKNIPAAWFYSIGKNGLELNKMGACDEVGAVTSVGGNRFDPLDVNDVSETIEKSHQFILEKIISKQEIDSSYVPVSIASIPQIRTSRKLCGKKILDITEVHKYQIDSIGMNGDWRKAGPVFEIPFGCLTGKKSNLFTCGRCISVTDEMWEVTRVIGCCVLTGEASGIAASLTSEDKFSVIELQNQLTCRGVILHEEDL